MRLFIGMRHTALVRELLRSGEPSIRWRTLVRVLGESPRTPRVRALERAVRASARVRALLSHAWAPYRENTARSVYYKWQGVQWALASLADVGHPRGDRNLGELRDRMQGLWTRPSFRRTYTTRTKLGGYGRPAVPVVRGRARRCASQQGNALLSICRLGLCDDGTKELASLLVGWQWPDGGWNCDRDPGADTSSFMETLTPMRGLAAFAKETGDIRAKQAARRAAEVFLERRLFRRRSDGRIIRPEFSLLHYPLYYHYDLLGGLKGLAELGLLSDPRCREALDLLESKELPTGGWPAEARYYRVSEVFRPGSEFVDWGPVSGSKMNEWVTTDALYVLREAGR